MADQPLYVGIDYGTSQSAIAYNETTATGTPEILALPDGNFQSRGMYSAVRLKAKDSHFLIAAHGWHARFPGEAHADQSVFLRAKLDIGSQYFAPSRCTNQTTTFRTVEPTDIAAIILHYLRTNLEKRKSIPIDTATISIPASWNPEQRQATKFAALAAGFQNVELIEEPLAALTYLWNERKIATDLIAEKQVMVVDIGGGTCDIAVLKIPTSRKWWQPQQNYMAHITHVAGDERLGGELIDDILLKYLLEKFYGSLDRPPMMTEAELNEWVEGFKKTVNESTWRETADHMHDWRQKPFHGSHLVPGTQRARFGNSEFHRLLTQEKQPALNGQTVSDTFTTLVQDAVQASGGPGQFQSVILVGGSSYLYFVPPIIAEVFPNLQWDESIFRPDAPEKCVVRGAVWHEKSRRKNNRLFEPRLFHDVSFVFANDTIPIIKAGAVPLPFQPRWYSKEGYSKLFSLEEASEELIVNIYGRGQTPLQEDIRFTKKLRAVKGVIQPEHTLEAKVAIDVDGIIHVDVHEDDNQIEIIPDDSYPLQGVLSNQALHAVWQRLPELTPRSGNTT